MRPVVFLSTLALAAAVLTGGTVAADRPAAAATSYRTVMMVGNNWDGTATIVDARTHRALRTINIVPDLQEELAAIHADPARLAYYLAIQQGVGEGHDQYVDDMFTTRDGRYVAVSRPSLGDVVWIDLKKALAGRSDSIVREQSMDGYRTDHMAVSWGRNRLLVSDSTDRKVNEYAMRDQTLADGRRVRMGDRLRSFPSGETPHESNYTHDNKLIYHASIGRVYTPGDTTTAGGQDTTPATDPVKGDRWFQQVDARTFKILRRWDMHRELAEAGHPGMSGAVRPMAIAPDERTIYFQVSFFHGFVEFRLDKLDPTGGRDYTSGGKPEPRYGVVTRLVHLPNRVPNMPREQYVLDSAHHGIAISPYGHKLCVAGTMDNYAAIVHRGTWTRKLFTGNGTFQKPYWATQGPGNTCWMSMSGTDKVVVFDFATERVVAQVPVGDHPQRVRVGRIQSALF